MNATTLETALGKSLVVFIPIRYLQMQKTQTYASYQILQKAR